MGTMKGPSVLSWRVCPPADGLWSHQQLTCLQAGKQAGFKHQKKRGTAKREMAGREMRRRKIEKEEEKYLRVR